MGPQHDLFVSKLESGLDRFEQCTVNVARSVVVPSEFYYYFGKTALLLAQHSISSGSAEAGLVLFRRTAEALVLVASLSLLHYFTSLESESKPKNSRSVFYKLLRPEFVLRYPGALTSDGFCAMGRNDPNHHRNNNDLVKATLMYDLSVLGNPVMF